MTKVPGACIQGVFINLDISYDRRESCTKQLNDCNLITRYRRLSGIDGKTAVKSYPNLSFTAGKLGCWLSHIKAMELGLEHDCHHHILEDDFLLTPVFKNFSEKFENLVVPLNDWDIIFTDVDVAGMRDVSAMSKLIKQAEKLVVEKRVVFQDARSLFAAGNSSYIINRERKERVLTLMRHGPKTGLPNDLYMRKLIREGVLKAFVTVPFVTSVSGHFNNSTIWGNIEDTNPSIMFSTMFRQSLAFGSDTSGILETFRQRINQLQPISNRGMIYAQLVAHFVSDDYKPY
ncbi:MAG: glycosyltransferase family 25 protein [Porticoccaceae bacterium]